jgi:hypothetical protein
MKKVTNRATLWLIISKRIQIHNKLYSLRKRKLAVMSQKEFSPITTLSPQMRLHSLNLNKRKKKMVSEEEKL